MDNTKYSKKKVALSAALVVAIIALAGVGYAAAHSFTGKTTSIDQSVDTDYVVVSLSDPGYVAATEFHAVWNSVTVPNTSAGTGTLTYYDFVESDSVTYDVTVDASVLETASPANTVTLKAQWASAQAALSGYGIKVTFDGNEYTFDGAISANGIVFQNVSITPGTSPTKTMVIELYEHGTPAPNPYGEYITETPASTSVTIPAIIFTAEATQATAAP